MALRLTTGIRSVRIMSTPENRKEPLMPWTAAEIPDALAVLDGVFERG